MTRLALALLLLGAASSGAQEIESMPLDPPSESAPEGEDAGSEAPSPAIEFKRAPFTTRPPSGPDPIAQPETTARPGAILRLLDMMTAETDRLEVATGETRDLGRLAVRLAACAAPKDGAAKGTKAYLTVTDGLGRADTPVFQGWMFAASPALSAMDHRRYDLWLISCTNSEGGAVSDNE